MHDLAPSRFHYFLRARKISYPKDGGDFCDDGLYLPAAPAAGSDRGTTYSHVTYVPGHIWCTGRPDEAILSLALRRPGERKLLIHPSSWPALFSRQRLFVQSLLS
jgi:hypothetical protein